MFTGKTSVLIRATAAGLLLLGTVRAAEAQSGVDPGRAFRGVFTEAEAATTSLAFSADIYQGIQRPGTFLVTESQETFAGVAPALVFTRAGRSTTFGASASAIARYYTTSKDVRAMYEAGAIGLRQQFGRVAVQLQQSIVLQPTLQIGALRGYSAAALGSLDHMNIEQVGDGDGLLTASSRVGMSIQAQRYFWVSAGYGYDRFEFRGPTADLGIFDPVARRQEAYANVSKRFGRSTALRVGVRSVKGTDESGPVSRQATWVHNIDLGLDRLQSISITRSMTLSLNGGLGFMRQESTGQARALVAIGGAGLDKRIGRRARFGLTARRDLYFVEGLIDPVLTNGITARFEAPLARRWMLSSNGGYLKGSGMVSATGATAVGYTNSYANVRTTYKLRGPVSIYGEYLRFDQTFDKGVAQPGLFLRTERRSGLRIGIVLNVPLVGGERGVE